MLYKGVAAGDPSTNGSYFCYLPPLRIAEHESCFRQDKEYKPCFAVLSHVQFFATPWTAACQAPLSMEFSGKNTGVGCQELIFSKSCHPTIYEEIWKPSL